MKAVKFGIHSSAGRVLYGSIFRSDGKKLLGKGRQLTTEDIRLLEESGIVEVLVTELDDSEVGEETAVERIISILGCGSAEAKLAAGGRANLHATEPCCALVDSDLLRDLNFSSSIVVATVPNFTFLDTGTRLATVKSAPFAVPRQELDEMLTLLDSRGPVLQARPIRQPAVGVLYTDVTSGTRARQLFESTIRQRLERFHVEPRHQFACEEKEHLLKENLLQMLKRKPTMILVASTTAPAGPDDAVGCAMKQVGCRIERFLAPVEPGNLLLVGFAEDIPVVSAPGCYRSAKPNVLDFVMPPLLARYPLSNWEIASLGVGGLLG